MGKVSAIVQDFLPVPEAVFYYQCAQDEVLDAAPLFYVSDLFADVQFPWDSIRESARIRTILLDFSFHFGKLTNSFVNFFSFDTEKKLLSVNSLRDLNSFPIPD